MPGVRLLLVMRLLGETMCSSLRTKTVLAALPLCWLMAVSVQSQNANPSKPIVIGGGIGIDGTFCEHTKSDLLSVARAAGAGDTIIIIARRGEGESSRAIVRRRLSGLRDYLETIGQIQPKRVITAEGERVRGLGRVEIYVGGKLHTVFSLKRNKDFWRGCSTA